jgi:WD40 repeat protein
MNVQVAFSTDGRFLAAKHGDGPRDDALKVLDATTWQELYIIPKRACPLAFSPDGQHLATVVSVAPTFAIGIWDVTSRRESRLLRGHSWVIHDLAFSPDSDTPRLASASMDGTVRIWSVRTGEQIVDPPLPHLLARCVAFSADGQLLASGGDDCLVKIWDARSWKLLHEFPDLTARVHSIVFHPKGHRVLAWGGTDGTVKVWNVGTKEIRMLHGHTSWVESVAFSPDGAWLASASLDGTVKIWKTPSLPESTEVADK